MKFIHCADLHLDSKFEYLPLEKAKIMREELISSFERMIDFAVKNGVEAVIIAGDLFDGIPTSNAISRVLVAVERAKDVDFLYLQGNHDEKNVFSDRTIPSNLKILNEKAFQYGDVTIAGLTANSEKFISNINRIKFDEKSLNILVLHGEISAYENTTKNCISLKSLKEKNIDYLALGHYHSYSCGKIDVRGTYSYCGCLVGRGFDEVGEKGFNLLTVSDRKILSQFVPFARLKFVEVEVDVSDCKSNYDVTTKAILIASVNKGSNAVKIILKGENRINEEVNVATIRNALSDQFFFVKVVDDSVLGLDFEELKYNKSLLGEFVRQVSKSDIENLTKNKVIMCGIKALKGEEL